MDHPRLCSGTAVCRGAGCPLESWSLFATTVASRGMTLDFDKETLTLRVHAGEVTTGELAPRICMTARLAATACASGMPTSGRPCASARFRHCAHGQKHLHVGLSRRTSPSTPRLTTAQCWLGSSPVPGMSSSINASPFDATASITQPAYMVAGTATHSRAELFEPWSVSDVQIWIRAGLDDDPT